MTRDTISVKEFTEDTQAGLKAVCLHYDLWDLDATFQPETWAALAFILRQVPDLPEFFPRGQWKTIQEIENRLEEWAQGRV